MRNAYAALLSIMLAYSAYVGATTPRAASSSTASRLQTVTAGRNSTPKPTPPSQIQQFPKIADGMCSIDSIQSIVKPCDPCTAFCPAKEITELIRLYVSAKPAVGPLAATEKPINVEFVISSAADPLHTNMALTFDRTIDQIDSAAQASGYFFSRAWMPWDTTVHSESTDFTVRISRARLRDQVESIPGLMVFRGSSSDTASANRLLFVFVVGERPTGGLNPQQFQNALGIRQAMIHEMDVSDDLKTLRIFGPTFSGSLDSLAKNLDSANRMGFEAVTIRSGSVSSFSAITKFRNAVCTAESKTTDKCKGKPLVDFASFQFSDQAMEVGLRNFLPGREDAHSHVAILSEDETEFGSLESGSEASTESLALSEGGKGVHFRRLYYPRGIAQLRDAYQQNLKTQQASEIGKTPSPTGLPLSLGITGSDDDSVPQFAPLQSPLSQETIMQGIVSTLRAEHAKVVLIRASDPLDMVFLARYLRQNYPQARLITAGADLLMIHDFYDPQFHGILALTPYPLLMGAQFATRCGTAGNGDIGVQRVFPDSVSSGEFNAVLSLLSGGPARTPCDSTNGIKSGSSEPNYAQFGLPNFLLDPAHENVTGPQNWRPRLWLTAVGRNGYSPVAVLDGDSCLWSAADAERGCVGAKAAEFDGNMRSQFSVHLSVGWMMLWLGGFAATLFFAFVLGYPRVFSMSETLNRFGGGSTARNGLVFALSMLALGFQTILLLPAIVWLGRFGIANGTPEFWNGLWMMALGYLFSAAALGVCCYMGFRKRGDGTLATAGATICGLAIFVASVETCCYWSGPLDNTTGAFVYRYLDVGSGVSPVLPLLFLTLAWMWWCWETLTGVAATQEKEIQVPDARKFGVNNDKEHAQRKSGDPNEGALDRLRLRALAAQPREWPWRSLGVVPMDAKLLVPSVLAFGVIYLLMRPWEIAEAFEGQTYKIIYWIMLYSCLLLVCLIVVQIVGLWLKFRTLLRAIEAVPFRRGFAELKSLTWKPLWKLASNGQEEYRQLLRKQLDALVELKERRTPGKALETSVENAITKADAVSAEFEKLVYGTAAPDTELNVMKGFQAMQSSLAATAAEFLQELNEKWKHEPFAAAPEGSDAGKGADKKPAVEPPARNATLRTMERFLCLFYLSVILVPLRRLQTLIIALAGVFVFVLLSYSSYPFESRESFHALLICIFFGISIVVGIVYGQMFANPLLSRITNTTPGEVGLDFWIKLGTFVFVPLLSLLSVQFPEINSFLFSWLQPAMQSVK